MQEIVDKQIDDLLKMGEIEHSKAPFASPLLLVKKRGVCEFQRAK